MSPVDGMRLSTGLHDPNDTVSGILMSPTYFGEREHGPRPRTVEIIPPAVRRALIGLIKTGIGNGAYGLEFPEQCTDGYVPCGTDERAFWDTAAAEVPDLALPDNAWTDDALQSAENVDTVIFLELLEFCASTVARPIKLDYHPYMRHHHLDFNRDAGQRDFIGQVNLLFRRNGVAFEISDEGCARRLGSLGLREELREAEFNTGDTETNQLLDVARQRILLPREEYRRDALEKLWDAFERIKTLEPGANKRKQADRLLDQTADSTVSPQFRQCLGEEADALTRIGNELRIRHSETTQEIVRMPEQIDYLFHRMFSFLRLVLRATGRGG